MTQSRGLQNPSRWDTSYEWKVVTLLGLGFGLVGLDRWIIAPLFPVMMKDLGLGYQQLGNIVGILGLSWGFFAALMGGLSDKIGHRKVLIPAIVLFSLLSGLSGMATGFVTLILIRAVMGFTEGSFCPTSFAATAEASAPQRRGFNLGLQQSTFALFGLGLAPIIATQLLRVVPSWRYVFVVVAIPGFILAIFMFFVLRDPHHIKASSQREFINGIPPRVGFGIGGGLIGAVVGYLTGASPLLSVGDVLTRGAGLEGEHVLLRPVAEASFNHVLAGLIVGVVVGAAAASLAPSRAKSSSNADGPAWSKIFHSRNIVVSMFGLFCAMTGVFVLSAMMPNYLVDYLHLSTAQMGVVTSALGFGGFVGQFALPGLSDILGRKIVAILGFAATAFMLWLFIAEGPNPAMLFALLFMVSLFCLGLVSLLTGPIATESAPAGLVSSAVGIVVGAGEIFGGGVAPSLAGYIAQNYGIQYILYLALAGVSAGVIVCLFLKETAPRKVGAPAPVLVTSS